MDKPIDPKTCDLRHSQNERDHEAMRELIKVIHNTEERFLAREVLQIAKELENIKKIEERLKVLERWRYYILGAFGVLMILVPMGLKLIFGV